MEKRTDYGAVEEKLQDEFIYKNLLHQKERTQKIHENMSKGQRSQLEGATSGHIWNPLAIKINNNAFNTLH